ncbi:MAG: regulatory protein SipA [Thermosynechococcus sp.]|uniref:regulatory protein SipA n=1 Tax=Thermosynechococcus sp. TaxID=2814275 RepID=UPI00391C66EE
MEEAFAVGDRVRLVELPPYVKTAEPMPMLRPASILTVGEEGVILGQQPGNYWVVRLERGAFLLEAKYLERV